MAEKGPWDGESWQFKEGEPETVINTSDSDFSLSFAGPDGTDHEIIHSDATSSADIAKSIASDLNEPAKPGWEDVFTEQFDVKVREKPFLKKVELEFNVENLWSWPPSGIFKVRIERGLRIISSYKKEG